MSRAAAPLLPLLVAFALFIAPSAHASHLSMDMPGLGGAALAAPSFWLLAITTLAALLQGAWLVRSSEAFRDAGWVLSLSPLAVSAARAGLAHPQEGELAARIAQVGTAGGEHMWALLGVVALVVGFGAARVLEGWLQWQVRRERPRLLRAAFAFALTLPFVGLILATSTGLDWISSWIRWGGCGVALSVCAAAALMPEPDGESGRRRVGASALGGLTFVLAIAFSLLAEQEYVEALGHDALVHRDPFDPAVQWVRGLQEIAIATVPRARYGLGFALLPLLALAFGAKWRSALPSVATGLLVLAIGVASASSVSSELDTAALDSAALHSAARLMAESEEVDSLRDSEEALLSRDVLPRTARWLPVMRRPIEPAFEPVEPVRCAAWMAPSPTGG